MRKLAALALAAGLTGCISLPKLHVGAGVSAVLPDESALENTFQVDMFARVNVAMVQVEGSVGWKEYDYAEDTGFEEGTLESIPIAVTVRYVSGAALFRYFVGGGLLWNVTSYDEITGSALSADNAIGYRALAGVDIKVVEDFRMSVEVQYDFDEAGIESTILGETVDTSGLTARLAVAYNF